MARSGRLCAGAAGLAMFAACSAPNREGAPVGMSGRLESVAPAARCAAESVAAAQVRIARDVQYAARSGAVLRFDVAWSESGAPAPLVLLLHGGSWSGGNRQNLDAEMLSLARRGYTAATVQYRLTQAPLNVFPAAAADVRCALRVLRRRASDYHLDPSRVGVMGYSAGGHLASLLGTAAGAAALDSDACGEAVSEGGTSGGAPAGAGARDVAVQAVVSYAGPQDLRVNGPYTQEQADIVTNFLGVFPGDDPALATLASPIAHVAAGTPPFLLIHGTDDDLVPVAHARRMAASLREVGTPATVIELRGIGHGFVGFTAGSHATVRCSVVSFLDRWLHGSGAGMATDATDVPSRVEP